VDKAFSAYLHESVSQESFQRQAQSNGKPTITTGKVHMSQTHARFDLEIQSRIAARTYVHLRLTDGTGITAGFGSVGAFDPRYPVELAPGVTVLSFEFPVSYLANGTYFASLDVELPDTEWDTVGGLVFNLLGHVPEEGECVRFQGLEFRTERVQGRRIVSVQIRPSPASAAEPVGAK